MSKKDHVMYGLIERMTQTGGIRIMQLLGVLFLLIAVHVARSEPPIGVVAKPKANKTNFADPRVDALVDASEKGDIKEIDRLVASGVRINVRSKDGMSTPLYLAIWRQFYGSWAGPKANKAGIKRLLEHGADPNYHVPLSVIRSLDDDGSIGRLTGWSIIHLAADSEDDAEWLELLLKHGANPNMVYPGFGNLYTWDMNAGWTPIFDAIQNDNMKSVNLLIRAGADVNHQDNEGNTPMMHAAACHAFDIVNRLVEAGADYRIRNNCGEDLAYFTIESMTRTGWLDPQSENGREAMKVLTFLEKKGIDIKSARKRVTDDWNKAQRRVKEGNSNGGVPKGLEKEDSEQDVK